MIHVNGISTKWDFSQPLETQLTCLDAFLAQMLLLINIAEHKSTALSSEDIIFSCCKHRDNIWVVVSYNFSNVHPEPGGNDPIWVTFLKMGWNHQLDIGDGHELWVMREVDNGTQAGSVCAPEVYKLPENCHPRF